MDGKKDEEKKAPEKIYTWKDLYQFEHKQIYSSIGKMVVSEKLTYPKYSFGSSTRKQMEKVYSNAAMVKTQFVGKNSKGPKYQVTDVFDYKKQPSYQFGKQTRSTLGTGPIYDYHLREDLEFDVNQADKVRRGKRLTVRIGLEGRFSNDPKKYKATPGPQYNPGHALHKRSKTKYSFGYKRDVKGSAPLKILTGTPNNVGPGLYNVHTKLGVKSKQRTKPKYSVPKNPRFSLINKKGEYHETYDTSKSCGYQANSKKNSRPAIAFGKANRNYKTGMFKSHMAVSKSHVRIQHPRRAARNVRQSYTRG